MPKCKECEYFQNLQDGDEGYCRAHAASVQKVSSQMDSEQCPIKKFSPKE